MRTFVGEDRGSYRLASAGVPNDWGYTERGQQVQLVLCFDRVEATFVNSCPFETQGTKWTVEAFSARYRGTLREAKSAAVIAEGDFDAQSDGCPFVSVYRSGQPNPQPSYALPRDGVEAFVAPHVLGTGGAVSSDSGPSSGFRTVTTDTTLTADHDGEIVIDADDVTLDCAGHQVIGEDAGEGIKVPQRTNVTVRNCTVSGFEFGIVLRGADGNLLEGNTVTSNRIGFHIVRSDGGTFSGNEASGNADIAFDFVDSSRNTVLDNTVAGTAMSYSFRGSDDNLIEGNRATGGTGWFAFGFFEGSSDNRVVDNEARLSAIGFVIFTAAHDNVFTANTATRNSQGFSVFGDPGVTGNRFTDNVATSNEGSFDDATSGDGTSGTANTYAGNECSGMASEPSGLCATAR